MWPQAAISTCTAHGELWVSPTPPPITESSAEPVNLAAGKLPLNRANPARAVQMHQIHTLARRSIVDCRYDRSESLSRNLFLRQILIPQFMIRTARQHGATADQRLLLSHDRP